jgi:hypothetical protein
MPLVAVFQMAEFVNAIGHIVSLLPEWLSSSPVWYSIIDSSAQLFAEIVP